MKAKKTYAVFGLGRYGIAVARELVENGMEVIAIDTEQKIVNDAAAYLPVCKCDSHNTRFKVARHTYDDRINISNSKA